MKKIIFLLNVCIIMICAEAKGKSNKTIPLTDTISLKRIDEQVLKSILDTSSASINWVIIYTSHCAGTSYILRTADSLKKVYSQKLKIILCSSENVEKISDIEIALANYHFEPTTYLIDEKKFKEKRSDDRYKGLLFRNKICPTCHIDLIGVPYSIFFDSKSKIVFSGFPSKNDIPFLINAILD